ncbi:hypothetical protein QUF64_11150 [Anaerolineales bacterium HSG6]|nr:hypothetical protein [Anaerolineales bacterium HSG6]MDM8530607.1 hypothetical protein [Anaerolineales bacterium HSG25]
MKRQTFETYHSVVVKMMSKMARRLPANMSDGSRRAVNPLLFNIKLTTT